MNRPYSTASATGDEIIPIAERIQEAVVGETFPNATMALLYTIFVIAYPEIKNEDLQRGIKDASEHICLLLDSYAHPVSDDPNERLKFN